MQYSLTCAVRLILLTTFDLLKYLTLTFISLKACLIVK